MNKKLVEDNIIEVIWVFYSLLETQKIKPWTDLLDEFEGSDGIKAEIKNIARQFEEKYPAEIWDSQASECHLNYIEEISKFAESELIKVFGRQEVKSSISIDTPLGNITAKVMPDKEYLGIAVLFNGTAGEPGAILEYDPEKKAVLLRVYGMEDPDGDPVGLFRMY